MGAQRGGEVLNPLELWPFVDDDRHFCSGVNSPGEVRGLALSGRNIGIAATEIRTGLIAELEGFGGGPLNVFVDSGAFSEVRFGANGREVVNPITDAQWIERLDLYRRMAYGFRTRAFLVLPDAVGDQAETLARLARYAPVARELAELGAQLILPVQGGELSGVAFVTAALKVLGLGLDRLVLGIPSRKAATSPEQLEQLCRDLKSRRRRRRAASRWARALDSRPTSRTGSARGAMR